jgi:hypothetical protein
MSEVRSVTSLVIGVLRKGPGKCLQVADLFKSPILHVSQQLRSCRGDLVFPGMRTDWALRITIFHIPRIKVYNFMLLHFSISVARRDLTVGMERRKTLGVISYDNLKVYQN